MASLQDLVAAAGRISARPDSVVSLIEIIEDPVIGADRLVPVVENDPGLTAGLLKLCNSPLYGFKRRIGSPREALVLVGNLTFARLCFTLSLEPVLHRKLPGYNLDLDILWQHSLATAYGAAFLMDAAGQGGMRERAFTAGLLHDIGKLALDRILVEQQAFPAAEVNRMTMDVEIKRAGHDHAEVGAAWLDNWELPDQIVQAVRWHHDPDRAGLNRRLAGAIHVADQIAEMTSRLRGGSDAVRAWIEMTFSEELFAHESVHVLAENMMSKQTNILSLAAVQGV